MKTLFILLLVALPAAAQSIDTIRPACVGPGGRMLICGSDFEDDPTVTIGGVVAEVLRNAPTKILVRVPDGAPVGDAVVNADGATATVEVIAAGAPVISHISSHTATPGRVLVVIGRHLRGADAVFVDDAGAAVETVPLRGRGHVGFFHVPDGMPLGAYTPGRYRVRVEAAALGSLETVQSVPQSGKAEWRIDLGKG